MATQLPQRPRAHTSDGEARPNVPVVTPLAAPALPPSYYTIGENARVGVLNTYATMLNAQLTYWAAVISPCPVISPAAGYPHSNVTQRVNDIIRTMAAACSEFSILTGAGQQMQPYISLDYNGFVPAMMAIRAQLSAMQTAKP